MKSFNIIVVMAAVLTTLAFTSCASNDVVENPGLNLNPRLLIDPSNVGEGKTIKLLILNQMDINSTAAFSYKTNLRELLSELFVQAFETRGYTVEVDSDAEVPLHSSYLNIILTRADNHVTSDAVKPEILAHIQLTLKAIHNGKKLTQSFESRRTEEVMLKAEPGEVAQVVDKAIAQIVKRVVSSQELTKFMQNQTQQTDPDYP